MTNKKRADTWDCPYGVYVPMSLLLKQYIIILVCSAIIVYPKVSFGYGYKRNEDPIITVFKSTVFYGKNNDWAGVESGIKSISDRINDVKNIFAVDLRPQLDSGIAQQDFQSVIKAMANLVYLAIREKYYWNLNEKLRMFERAKVRLRLAEEYYTLLLSGNVKKYDKRNNTELHNEIFTLFSQSRKTLGSIGFFGAGAVSPVPEEFERITKEIDRRLLIVFPYFESGKEITF